MKVLVLGASRGIGLEFVRQYAEAGDSVIATARDDEGIARLKALGATAFKLDVADPKSVSGLDWQLDGEKVDVALYVAGVFPQGGARTPPTQEEFDRTLHTNVLGAMQAIPQVTPMVEAAGAGKFVFITSGMAQIAGASLTVQQSVSAMRKAIAGLTSRHKGAFLDYDGSPITSW
jgi:NAD(P)-dependent dehydrogenase (short-subunit alcohol dehydrogenase family)